MLSPSVRVIGDEHRMWTVDSDPGSGRLALAQRKSPDGIDWSSPEWAKIDWSGPPLEPWHIEVVEAGSRLLMMLSARLPGRSGTQSWRLLAGDGLHWQEQDWDMGGACLFEAGKPYKPSLLGPAEGSPSGRLYTSSTDPQGSWYTALRPGPFRS